MTIQDLINQLATYDISGILAAGKVFLAIYVGLYAVLFIVAAIIIGKIVFRR